MKQKYFLIFCLFLPTWLFAQSKQQATMAEAQMFPKLVFKISEVMLHDVTNPPMASRFYAYSLLSAYEAVRQHESTVLQLNQLISHYPTLKPAVSNPIHYPYSAMWAMCETARLMLPSGELLKEVQDSLYQVYQQRGFSVEILQNSQQYAQEIAKGMVSYAQKDGYSKISTYPRYRPQKDKDKGTWYPTPPAYMEGVEPYWRTIRPFWMDSLANFRPAPPAEFSLDKKSLFYKQMTEVYEKSKNLTKEELAIARFWDCNPFALTTAGHLMIGMKKISPGGHWLGITGIVCTQQNISLEKSVLVHTLVALTLADAFITCWDEKYRSERIRPETAINQYIDAKWRPMLQTPPFPEYTSGHSVASTTVAELLTFLLGDNIAYTDTSEEYFGLPARKFQSFRQAAAEAAISRLYGGIHYRDAIEEGQKQGKKLAEFIIGRLKVGEK